MRNRMGVVIAVIACSLIVLSSVDAVCEEQEVRGHFLIGGTTLDLDGLNTSFTNRGYSEFSEDLYIFGGGFFFNEVNSRFLIGVEGRLLVGDQTSSVVGVTEYSAAILGGYGMLNAGYLAVESDRLDIFPILGIGVGGIRAKIAQSSFESILFNPHGPASVSTVSFLVNLGLEADFKVSLADNALDNNFFLIGVRGGYVFSPFSSGWYMEELSLTDDPDGGFNGPYVCLTIGGGGKFCKK
jgi:hypothetical protein